MQLEATECSNKLSLIQTTQFFKQLHFTAADSRKSHIFSAAASRFHVFFVSNLQDNDIFVSHGSSLISLISLCVQQILHVTLCFHVTFTAHSGKLQSPKYQFCKFTPGEMYFSTVHMLGQLCMFCQRVKKSAAS